MNWAALLLFATLGACHRAKTYAVTPDGARARLVGTTIPDIALGKSGHSSPGEATADGVEWAIEPGADDGTGGSSTTDGGERIMLMRAKLTSASGGTAVTVDLAPPPGADPARFKAHFDEHPAVAAMFRSIAAEQVDAVLTRHPFSFAAISGDMTVAVMSELPNIRQQLNNEANAIDERDRDTMHRAYDQAR